MLLTFSVLGPSSDLRSISFILLQSLTFKEKVSRFKDKTSEDTPNKYLLLWIVRLIHADPILMLHVSPSAPMRSNHLMPVVVHLLSSHAKPCMWVDVL